MDRLSLFCLGEGSHSIQESCVISKIYPFEMVKTDWMNEWVGVIQPFERFIKNFHVKAKSRGNHAKSRGRLKCYFFDDILLLQMSSHFSQNQRLFPFELRLDLKVAHVVIRASCEPDLLVAKRCR